MSAVTKSITLADTTVVYTLRRRRGVRRMCVSVRAGGAVILTMPRWVPCGAADRFLREKSTWLLAAIARLNNTAHPQRAGHGNYVAHKEAARELVVARLKELNAPYGYTYKRVTIRNNVSRWGSCSAKGTLSFDYRILFLPPALQDYLVVHELCHLVHMNHGAHFWNLVAHTIPDFAVRRQALRNSPIREQLP